MISQFLHEKLLKQYGEEVASQIEAGYRSARSPSVRMNPLRASRDEIMKVLEALQINGEKVPWYPDALLLTPQEEAVLRDSDLYREGKVYFQSLSSMLPPLALEPQPGEDILDMAAAPGGKTTQICALTGGKARITACERNAARAERLRFNLNRQGAGSVTVLQMDARQLDPFFVFDRILLDAPCSGSGTLQESSRGSFTPENLKKTSGVQRALLKRAIAALKPGREMVYSTCSVLREENESVIEEALKGGQVELVALDPARFPGLPVLPCTLEGALLVCPTDRFEGFFVARLKKKEESRK